MSCSAPPAFAEDKGHKYLIDSVKRLTTITDVPFTLVLAGDGPLLEALQGAGARPWAWREQVKFIGFRKDIKNLYKGSDLYVNSSQHEALSFLIIEAMARRAARHRHRYGRQFGHRQSGGRLRPSGEVRRPGVSVGGHETDAGGPGFPARCREGALRTVEEKFEIHKWVEQTYGVYEKAINR